MNLSDWKSLPSKKQAELLGDICSEVREGKMPQVQYVVMHPRAKLTMSDVNATCTWARSVGQGGPEQAEND